MDNEIDNSIIKKVVNKQRAIYIALETMEPPKFEDKFALCHQEKILQSQTSEEKPLNVNADSEKKIEIDSTKKVSTDTTERKNSGIYKIINKVNGKYYVGSTVTMGFTERWNEHRRLLLKNKHYNSYLQRAWNKYGVDAFEFIVVEYFDSIEKLILEAEQRYLDLIKSERTSGVDNSYNVSLLAGRIEQTEEVRKKIGNANRGRVASEEHKRKISEASKKYWTDETRKKRSELYSGENSCMYGKTGANHPSYGIKRSLETRQKNSDIMKRRWQDEDYRKEMSESRKGNKNPMYGKRGTNYGKPVSEATKAKLSAAAKRTYEVKRAAKQTSSFGSSEK